MATELLTAALCSTAGSDSLSFSGWRGISDAGTSIRMVEDDDVEDDDFFDDDDEDEFDDDDDLDDEDLFDDDDEDADDDEEFGPGDEVE